MVRYAEVPSEWQPQKVTKSNGTVLASGISEKDYRDYHYIQDIFPELYIYPCSTQRVFGYRNILMTLSYFELLYEMSYYQTGYAGAPNTKVSFDKIVTNKFWDYIACGLNIILWRAKEMEDILKERGYTKRSISINGEEAGIYELLT